MKILLTILVLAVLTTGASDVAAYSGVISIDSARVEPAQSFGVKVRLSGNDVALSAMTLPLKFNSADLRLDSISLNSSVWGSGFAGYLMTDDVEKTAIVTVMPSDIVYPLPDVSFVDGVVAEVFFTVEAGALPHWITVDSIYTDEVLIGDIHFYTRIDLSDNSGTTVYQPGFRPGAIEVTSPTSVENDGLQTGLPTSFDLGQNYPNPFNPTTTIAFSLPRASQVELDIFNILGQEVRSLADEFMEAGVHQVEFDAHDLPSGIYFYRLNHAEGTTARKMILLK